MNYLKPSFTVPQTSGDADPEDFAARWEATFSRAGQNPSPNGDKRQVSPDRDNDDPAELELSADEVDQIRAALDEPAEPTPALRELMGRVTK